MLPSLSQIRAWRTDHLTQSASYWTITADGWESSFESIARQMPAPGGYPWVGEAAEAARSRAKLDKLEAADLADCLRMAATAARGAAGDIDVAKAAAFHAIGEAHAEGFVVGEDLSLADRFTTASADELAARQAQAESLSAVIRSKAAALAAADESAAATITAAAAGLDRLLVDTVGTVADRPSIQLVDFSGIPLPEKPSWTSPGMPPGGWSDDPVTRAAQKIAYGHASTKHLASEWPPGTTREQLASEVERIMRAGMNPNGGVTVGRTSDGAPAIYDPKTNTLVIRDKGAVDAGTVFRPTRGEPYVVGKVPSRLPFLSPADLADSPARPRLEVPRAEPRAPRVGLPPIVGVPPLVGLPGAGAGDIPVLDPDGMPNPGGAGLGQP